MSEDEVQISQTRRPSTAEELRGGAAATGGGGEEDDAAVLQFLDSLDDYLTLLESLSSTLRQVTCICFHAGGCSTDLSDSTPLDSGGAMATQGEEEDNAAVLQFLDSLDDYLTLLDSLSSTLRQGWIDLAGARHSMGSSRISSALFDLKVHSAPTTVQMCQSTEGSLSEPHFTLSKWAALRELMHSREAADDILQKKSDISQLRHRGPPETADMVPKAKSTTDKSTVVSNSEVQMERSKSLLVFGTLISPKLRSAQVSFETALDAIVELVNLRSLMLSAFSQIQSENKSSNMELGRYLLVSDSERLEGVSI